MKKRLLIIALFSCIQSLAYSQITWDWAIGVGGKIGYTGSIDMARDAQGNIYVIGDFTGTRDFGSYTLFATGYSEVFVAKINSSGVCQWAVKAGANFSSAFAGGITVNGSNIFITGRFTNNLTLGGQTITTTGGDDIYIASLNPADGSCNWLNKAGGNFNDNSASISPENAGGFFICGSFTDLATFGTQTLNSGSVNNIDMFLAKYDASGNCTWAIKAGSPTSEDKALGIKQLAGGGIFLTGYFQSTATFGVSTTVTAAGGYDFFLARYDAAGNLIWVQQGGGSGSDLGYSIGSDQSGNMYVAGFIGDTAQFGTLTAFDNGYGSIMIAKYNNAGTPQWVKTAGSVGDDSGYDISVDAVGSSYVTGYISGNANFSGTSVTGVQSNDAFMAKYDNAGNLKWVTKVGSTSFDRGKAVVADVGGYCYVAGDFTNTVNFGSIAVTSPTSEWGVYIARLGGGTVGLNELKDQPFTIFPNPTHDFTNLDLTKIKDAVFTIDIISLDGKVISTLQLGQQDAISAYKVDLSKISAGSYQLIVNTSKGSFSTPLQITR